MYRRSAREQSFYTKWQFCPIAHRTLFNSLFNFQRILKYGSEPKGRSLCERRIPQYDTMACCHHCQKDILVCYSKLLYSNHEIRIAISLNLLLLSLADMVSIVLFCP
ncbi:unnamed protein product [Polarella glacialis]|uniref:Uncharacterized protein n=1 Tax=Polarella glacialis TaxID=89957 RepID=A0A813KQ54_POLGL|nr:unnamed protein product [Polarella glacialis]